MAFPSRRETYDSNTPSDSSGRTQYRGYPKRTTIQSDRESISNSSVHTTSTATTYEDLFNYLDSEQHPGGVYPIYDSKSLHSLDKMMFCFRNQSQSSVGTISEAGSARSSIAASTPKQEIRSLNIPSFEDEDESSDEDEDDFANNILPKASAPVFPDPASEARARAARVLESKVARMASKKCPVEEVVALQKEVDRWLTEATAADAPQSTSLYLSSLLLKAILVNHIMFSDVFNAAKNAETSLKLKVDELEIELKEQKYQYNQKDEECQSLRTELSRFVSTSSVSTASSAASAHAGLSSTSRSSASPPSSRVASPTSSPSYVSNISSPLSRLELSRSASVAPTPHLRSASVAPTSTMRSGSTVPAQISTPGISSSSYRSAIPAVPSYRSSTPASPSPIRKSRTMSMSQPPPSLPSDPTPAVPSYRSSTPASPSPVRKSRTMSMSQPPPLPPSDPTPAVPSYRSSTPASPSPIRKSRTMSMSQPPPLPPSDRWPAALTASISNKPFSPPGVPRPLGPRIPTRA